MMFNRKAVIIICGILGISLLSGCKSQSNKSEDVGTSVSTNKEEQKIEATQEVEHQEETKVQAVVTEAKEIDSLEEMRNQIETSSAMCGVAFLGYAYGCSDLMSRSQYGEQYIEKYPFIGEVTISNCIDYDGYEIYCIVPTHKDDKVTVYSYYINDETDIMGEKGEVIFTGVGEPILLCANYSDIVANTCVVIESKDGARMELGWNIALHSIYRMVL